MTEVDKLNMAMKFVTPVSLLRFLSLPPPLANPPGEKSLFYRRKNPLQLTFAEEETQMAREAKHARSFFHCGIAECQY